jgi:hypothetical protein
VSGERRRNDRTAQLWGECRRKNKYATFAIADQQRIRLERERGVLLSVYKCPHCRRHHLTKDWGRIRREPQQHP